MPGQKRRWRRWIFAVYVIFLHVVLAVVLWKSNFLGIAAKNLAPLLEPVLNTSVPYSALSARVIELDLPTTLDRSGGLITADLDGDGRRDFVVTGSSFVTASDHTGSSLWSRSFPIRLSKKSEAEGLPGSHAPGIVAADVDGAPGDELLFLTDDGPVLVVDGRSGEIVASLALPHPAEAERWEHLVVASFRGAGELDLLLQATDAIYFRSPRFLAAYPLDRLLAGERPEPLWSRDDFRGHGHGGVRVADLDGDGRDEVLGATILGPDGELLSEIPIGVEGQSHVDALHVADVRHDLPGLEVVALEESPENHVFLYNRDGVIWKSHYRNLEPQFAAIGDFDPARPGLEIWCRSRVIEHQTPFVFDARGELIAKYWMNLVMPPDWTGNGMAIISPIDWTGGPAQLAAAAEFGKKGDVAIFDPISGRVLHRFRERTERLYVADVSGDWREELVVLSGSELHVYANDEPNPQPDRQRLWNQRHYTGSKMTWNSYNPS